MRTAVVLFTIVGCTSSSAPQQQLALNGAPEDVFTITRVSVENDEIKVVNTSSITRAEQVTRAMQRKQTFVSGDPQRQALTSDASCAGTDMWMFDQTSLQGNELCVYGSGVASLGSFSRPGGTWSQAVRSFWAGNEPGSFTDPCRPAGCTPSKESFSASEYAPTASSIVQFAVTIAIDLVDLQ